MMLKVLLLFILLIAGIVLGPMLAGHQGYVLIQTDNYNIETSVTGLAIILILGVVVLFAVEWVLRRIFRTGAHTELRPGEIHCVRAEMERHLQALQISGGAQQLRFIHATPPLIVSNSVWPRTPGIRRSS